MYKFLNKKLTKDYPFPIDTHKMFVNLYKIPNGREIPQIEYYLGQLYKYQAHQLALDVDYIIIF